MLYRTYPSVRYRYESLYRHRWYRYPYRTEPTEVSGTFIDVIPNLPTCPVPVTPAVYNGGMPLYVPYRTYQWTSVCVERTHYPIRNSAWNSFFPVSCYCRCSLLYQGMHYRTYPILYSIVLPSSCARLVQQQHSMVKCRRVNEELPTVPRGYHPGNSEFGRMHHTPHDVWIVVAPIKTQHK